MLPTLRLNCTKLPHTDDRCAADAKRTGYAVRDALQRMADETFAWVAIIVLAPLFVVVAAAIKATSAGPVFAHTKWTCADGRDVYLLSFRVRDIAQSGCSTTGRGQQGLTLVGYALRFLGVEHLPQALNVLRGDFSFFDKAL